MKLNFVIEDNLLSTNSPTHIVWNKIKEIVGDFEIVLSEIGKDIDKRDYIVSNEKVEKRGFCPKYTLEDGINELVKFYKFLIPDQSMRNI